MIVNIIPPLTYVRDGDPLPSEITLVSGNSQSFSLQHIYQEIDTGIELAIDMKEKNELSWVRISNKEAWTDIIIDAEGLAPGERFIVVLESFNTLSDAYSALKTDTMTVNIYLSP